MIATLTGKISEKIADVVVLEAAGVGYGLLVTGEDFGGLALGQPAKLYVYEHIREQAHDLFGFISLDTKQLFEQLLGVNGVGPKMALNVLSIGRANDVRAAIASGDTKYIQVAQGVGKRVAERIVVDLKDKVGLPGVDLAVSGILQPDLALRGDEAAAALVSLGYSAQDATKMLQTVDSSLPLEERIKQALKA
ncbi:MAG TPA: Holliday junction branch migration protein RuvA [Candidatus Saccharimonadales bacterium]|nr:Holliday junction branch migration protein RuvA [Candidatus Saccharimonadales bacterium]